MPTPKGASPLAAVPIGLPTLPYCFWPSSASPSAGASYAAERDSARQARWPPSVCAMQRLMRQGQCEQFYEEVMRALLGYAADRLNISMSDLTKDNVAEAMTAHHVPDELVKNYTDVMAECEFARFAPGEPAAKMEKMYTEASETINRLNASIKKNK